MGHNPWTPMWFIFSYVRSPEFSFRHQKMMRHKHKNGNHPNRMLSLKNSCVTMEYGKVQTMRVTSTQGLFP